MINKNGIYSGELELNATGKIFNLDILILEYKKDYNGYIKYCKIKDNDNNKLIMFLEYRFINKVGHYDILKFE